MIKKASKVLKTTLQILYVMLLQSYLRVLLVEKYFYR